jgi:glycosyltransferase involved in cell wall biosynthesis
MKIVHITESLGRGGAETLLVGVVNGLPNDEHFIITLSPENAFKNTVVNATIISLHCKPLWKLPVAILRLRRALRKIKPDVVHAHLFWSTIVAKFAVNKNKHRFFYTNHAVQSYGAFTSKYLIFLEKFTYRKWHTLISVSAAVEKDYCKYIKVTGPHFVLYNFVEDIYFNVPKATVQASPVKGVAVGRLALQKNYPYLLDAVKHAGMPLTVDIYGVGPEKEMLQQKILADDIKNVQLKYLHPKIYEVLPQYNFFVMSSIFEGQPVSVLEAMAVGLPVVLADIPELKEVAGDAGIYFSLSDTANLTHILKDIATGKINLQPYAQKSINRAAAIAKKADYLQRLTAIYMQ